MILEKIKKGDKVEVTNRTLASYGLVGIAQNDCNSPWCLCTVYFEDWLDEGPKTISFKQENIRLYTGKGEKEMALLPGFKRLAVVNLAEDSNKKDYSFALYDEEYAMIVDDEGKIKEGVRVAVETRTKTYPLLGTIKEIKKINTGDSVAHITAQVVGVFSVDNYEARKVELKRRAEIAKKKAAIEEELNKEILKRKSLEYYEEMAEKYADNPVLQELVATLKELGD